MKVTFRNKHSGVTVTFENESAIDAMRQRTSYEEVKYEKTNAQSNEQDASESCDSNSGEGESINIETNEKPQAKKVQVRRGRKPNLQ